MTWTERLATTNQFRFNNYRLNMAKSHPFIQALSLGGTTSTTTPGPIPGLGCQALMIDVSKIFHTFAFTTTTRGSFSQTVSTKYSGAAANVTVWSQAIWADKGNKSTHISRTSSNLIRPLPPAADFNGKFGYRYGPSSGVIPTVSFTPTSSYVPLYRYK